MKLVVTEKNDAATKIAALLGVKKPKADKVYSTPVYRFEVDGEEWVTIGLRGHILEPDFTPALIYKKRGGWRGVTAEGEATAHILAEQLRSRGLRVTRLARGVPVGSELEYVDLGTIAHAFMDRR